MKFRSSGILLHPTSLPGPFGIGDLGPEAFRFVDFLHLGRQHLWQMLPINPTDPAHQNSPYYSPSAFAGDPLLISPQILYRQGLLEAEECSGLDSLPVHVIDFEWAREHKYALLNRAVDRFLGDMNRKSPAGFFRKNDFWLDDYALFMVLDREFKRDSWSDWPEELRDRNPTALAKARETNHDAILREKILQFLFFQQWLELKKYCRRKNIRIFGDMPIYVPFHSADVWANPRCFKLDGDCRPVFLSGVPPDYFSETGQLWGHPVYDWERIRADGYQWWLRRFAMCRHIFDIIRIDHFRGLIAYWQVPSTADTALSGQWQNAYGEELLAVLYRHFGCLQVVAEDLGSIDAEVREVMHRFSLPGMRVLQFAFGDDFPHGSFLPHNHIRNCIVYTGTHDNNTLVGWLRREAGTSEKERLFAYLGRVVEVGTAAEVLIRLAMASVADTVIIPMQDLLGLDETARTNHPSQKTGNWQWRMSSAQLLNAPAERLAELTRTYGRGGLE